MSTPFDHMASFKALDSDTQDQIMSKFKEMPPEKQQQIMNKANTPMQFRASEGATPIEPITDLTSKGIASYKENAPLLADALTESGTNPKLAKAVGATFAHIPEIAMAADAAPSVAKLAVSGAKNAAEFGGNLLTAITPGGRAAIGTEVGAAEADAGIKQVVPTVANLAKRLELPAGERSFADIVNKVKGSLAKGEPMSPQDLVDFRDLVKQQFGAGKIAPGTKLEALTSGTNKDAGSLLNQLVEGRKGPAMKYAQVQQIQNGLRTLAKAGAGVSGIGLTGVILKKLAGY